MAELSQQDLEALEVAAQDAKHDFITALTASPKAFAAFQLWQHAEVRLFEARRGRRESEAHE